MTAGTYLVEVATASLDLLNRMSPYLLFGFLVAGGIRLLIRPGSIARHLGGGGWRQVVKATIVGIPLPLCSCGVLPAAMTLREEGAGRGSVVAFLLSTPATGIDSILATYGMLGGLFAVFRVLSAFLAGLIGGWAADLFDSRRARRPPPPPTEPRAQPSAPGARIGEALRFSFRVLLRDTGGWLLLGVVLGGAITRLLPPGSLDRFLGGSLLSMLAMFLVGIPMYICSAGSIPIAASLMAKGLSPGAALVFLMAGPVTNTVGLMVIVRTLGRSAAVIILAAVLVSAVGCGLLLDLAGNARQVFAPAAAGAGLPPWLEWGSTSVLLAGILANVFLDRRSLRPAKRG
ncbi:MAG TPA: permease [bacterium]|nr:permease [bacterium]HPQ65248.1 permease [bacterium]